MPALLPLNVVADFLVGFPVEATTSHRRPCVGDGGGVVVGVAVVVVVRGRQGEEFGARQEQGDGTVRRRSRNIVVPLVVKTVLFLVDTALTLAARRGEESWGRWNAATSLPKKPKKIKMRSNNMGGVI